MLLIQRAGIEHWLGRFVSAEDYEQVAYHGGFFRVIQFHDIPFVYLSECPRGRI